MTNLAAIKTLLTEVFERLEPILLLLQTTDIDGVAF